MLQLMLVQVVFTQHLDMGKMTSIIGQKYGLDVLCPVDEKGVMTEEAPGFAGLFYDKANKAITEKLEEVGALLKLNIYYTLLPT